MGVKRLVCVGKWVDILGFWFLFKVWLSIMFRGRSITFIIIVIIIVFICIKPMAFLFWDVVNFISPPSLLDICFWIVTQSYEVSNLPNLRNIVSRNNLGKGVVVTTKLGEKVGTNQLEAPVKVAWLKLGIGTKVLVGWKNALHIFIK